MGRRTSEDASIFTAKLAAATSGDFQLSTDGSNAYPAAVQEHLGGESITARLSRPLDRRRPIPSAATRPPR
jgi:hypothetical protein